MYLSPTRSTLDVLLHLRKTNRGSPPLVAAHQPFRGNAPFGEQASSSAATSDKSSKVDLVGDTEASTEKLLYDVGVVVT
jgi:hypothetical protein